MNTRPNLKRLLFKLSALVDLGHEVTSSREYADRMRTALYVITGMFSIPRAALFIYDAGRSDLAFLTGKGVAHLADVRMGIDSSDLALLPRNEPVNAQVLRNTGLFKRNADVLDQIQAAVLVPLHTKEEFVGLVVLGPRLNGNRLLQMEREVLQVASHQVATAICNTRLFTQITDEAAENRRLYENMRSIYHDTIRAFATAIDAKDQYTKHHSFRVARLAAAIAHELQWSKNDVEAVYIAGLLHDIGKISLDVDLINKGVQLSAQDREKIRRQRYRTNDFNLDVIIS